MNRRGRLEKYSWREEELKFNTKVSQYRTAIKIPSSEAPLRIHFIHAHSPHANAIPLLLIPPFPFTNLSLAHLTDVFSDPEDATSIQPFHLVIPSLPGLGFSDALPNNTPVIPTSAEMLDVLMKRLGYEHYVVTHGGPSSNSLSRVDWCLVSHISQHYQDSCLAAQFISPPLEPPSLREAPVEWTKWKVAGMLRRPMLGYAEEDLEALQRLPPPLAFRAKPFAAWQNDAAGEPNTLAYSLCDSPSGLLVFVLMMLRVLGPRRRFTPKEIITFTALVWLPGPEATLRFWASCASHQEKTLSMHKKKPKIAVTAFLENEEVEGEDQLRGVELNIPPRPLQTTYSCPAWASTRFDVVYVHRVSGKPGMTAWERPEVIAEGVRELAKVILANDERLQKAKRPGTVILEQVVTGAESRAVQASADPSGNPVQAGPSSPPKKTGGGTDTEGQEWHGREAPPIASLTKAIERISTEEAHAKGARVGGDEHEDDNSPSSEGSPDTVIAISSKQMPVEAGASDLRRTDQARPA